MEQEEFEKYKEASEQMFKKIIQDSSNTFFDGKVVVGYYSIAIYGLRERINKKQISEIQLKEIKKMWLEKEKTLSDIVGKKIVNETRSSISLLLSILKTDVLIKCACEACELKGNICPGKTI